MVAIKKKEKVVNDIVDDIDFDQVVNESIDEEYPVEAFIQIDPSTLSNNKEEPKENSVEEIKNQIQQRILAYKNKK